MAVLLPVFERRARRRRLPLPTGFSIQFPLPRRISDRRRRSRCPGSDAGHPTIIIAGEKIAKIYSSLQQSPSPIANGSSAICHVIFALWSIFHTAKTSTLTLLYLLSSISYHSTVRFPSLFVTLFTFIHNDRSTDLSSSPSFSSFILSLMAWSNVDEGGINLFQTVEMNIKYTRIEVSVKVNPCSRKLPSSLPIPSILQR